MLELTYSRTLKRGDSFHRLSPGSRAVVAFPWIVGCAATDAARAMPKHFGAYTHSPQELMSQLTRVVQ